MYSLNSYLAVYSKLIYGELRPTVQARQTWPNSGGGVAEGQSRFDKVGGCNNFFTFYALKISLFIVFTLSD